LNSESVVHRLVIIILSVRCYICCVVTAKNPPPICVFVPYMKNELSLCVDLYNLEFSKQEIDGCVKVVAKLAFFKLKGLDLGCFHIPLYTVAAQHTAAAVVQSIQAARLKNDRF